MNDLCEFHSVCEDYTIHNQKCNDNTAFCAMRVQLMMLKQAERGI